MTGMMIQTVKWVSEVEGLGDKKITSESVPMNESDKMFGSLSSMLGIYCVSV